MKIGAILLDTCRELVYRKTLVIYFGLVTLTHLVFIMALQTDVANGVIASLSVFGVEGSPSPPFPHPATQRQYPMGGRVGEWAGAASNFH